MIVIIVALQIVAKAQSCSYNPNYEDNLLSLDHPSLMMKEFQGLGYGYWFKYQPYIHLGEGQQFKKSLYSERKLLSAEFYNNTDLTIYHYAQFQTGQVFEINHYVELYTMQQFTIIKHTFNNLNYEGKWILFALQFDVKLQVLFYLDDLTIYDVLDQPRRTDNMKYYLGYYGQIQNSQNNTFMSFSQYRGRISNFFILNDLITQTNIQSIIENGCNHNNLCGSQVQLLIFQQIIFNGDNIKNFNLENYRDQTKYSISMWVKQAQQRLFSDQKQVLLRISLTLNYTDLDMTDKELYIEYLQSVNEENYGIIISSYSFEAPIYGNRDQSNNQITIFDSVLPDGLKQWHYIQYDYGNTQGNFNNKLTLIIPSILYQQVKDFGKNLNHFTGSPLYFNIGGGILQYEKQFNGQINNFNFYYCQTDDLLLMNQCYYQCNTCDGPTKNNCLSCPANSNRILQESQCLCAQGFIEQQLQDQVCQLFEDVYPIINIIENPLMCDLNGYDQCSDEIICSYGFFKYQNKCYLCPEYENDQKNILCVDCRLNPNNWNFQCQDDFLSEQEDYVLVSTRRQYPQLYYMINFNDQYDLAQCHGCKQYKLEQDKLIILECLEKYYLSDNQCQNCDPNCKTCNQIKCLTCEQGFVYSEIDSQCKKCNICGECTINQQNQVECSSCPSKYYLTDQYQCNLCGANCETCNQQQCLSCIQNTFIQIDGLSCQFCSIENCEICYYQYDNINTLDFKFQQLPLEVQYQTKCARCQDHYYLQDDKCLNQNELTGVTVNQFDGCVTGIVQNSNTLVCLIGSVSTAIEINNCQSLLKNCKNCIKDYNGSNRCIICIDGYYVNQKLNECLECPINCYQCLQQSQLTQDGWKYKIRSYYEYFINSLKDHYFEQYGLDSNSQNYQIVCTSCNPGQILYNNTCIQDCDNSCQLCQIVNGFSQCLQCKPNQFGYMRSLDNQFQCIKCPFKCRACIQRDTLQLKQINSVYNNTDEYSTQCIQQFDNSFLDNGIGLVIECKLNQKCYNKLLIKLNVYCDQDDYIIKQQLSHDVLFKQGSLFIDDAQTYIDNIFTQDLYNYLNQQVIKEAEIQLLLEQGQVPHCSISQQNISNSLLQNIFALQKIQLTFMGDPVTSLQINGYLNLINFTDYVFENIIFVTNQLQPAINIMSHKFANVQLTNTQIAQSQDFGLVSPQFNIQNPQLIQFKSFSIIGAQITDSQIIFNLKYTQMTSTIIQITDFILQDSMIVKTQFFSIQKNQLLQQISILCQNLQFINSQFNDNFIFYHQQQQTQDIGLIEFIDITIINSLFSNSSIISAECVKQSTIQGIQSQMLAILNSTLFRQNIMVISNAQFEYSTITFSTLFSNIAGFTNIVEQTIILLSEITFSNTMYIGSNSFINIIQQQNQKIQLTLDKINLLNNHLPEIYPMVKQITDVSYRQSSIYISCNTVQLKNIIIDRAPGYSEISLTYTTNILIENMIISTNQLYRFKLIQSDLFCFQMTSFLDLYFALYIFDFQQLVLNDININNTYVIDYSIVIIESASQIDKLQQESITITKGNFNFNRLAILSADRDSSIIKIQSSQLQQLSFNDIYITENILKLYLQDNLKVSSTTFLIKSDYGNALLDNLTFQQNYIINSTGSPLLLQVDLIQISNTKFYNNSVFDFNVWKSSFSWGYLGDVFYEQIYKQDHKIMSYGGSAYIFAQFIYISEVTLNGSYAFLGGSFYIRTKGIGNVSITNSNFSHSVIHGQQKTSYGGTIIVFSDNSYLTFQMDNINVNYVFSRYYGGFLMVQPSSAAITTFVIQNIVCLNCFAIYGGFFTNISPFATSFGMSAVNFTNITLSNNDLKWWTKNLDFSTFGIAEYQELQASTNLIWVFMIQVNMQHVKVYNSTLFALLYIINGISVSLNDFDVQDYYPFLSGYIIISDGAPQINITNFRFSKTDQINYTNSSETQCNQSLTFVMMQQMSICMPGAYTEDQYNASSYVTKAFIDNQYECFKLNTFYFSGLSYSAIFFIPNMGDLLQIKNVTITSVNLHSNNWGLIGIVNPLALQNSVLIDNLIIKDCSCGYIGCLLISQSSGFLTYNPEASRILTEQQQYSVDQFNVTAIVQNSKFISNKAIIGTGISAYGLNLLIKNCTFLNNYAKQVGGAIFFTFEPFNLFIINSIITNNTSGQKQGDGIYLQIKSFSQISKFNNIIALNGDQDVYEWPYSLGMQFSNTSLYKTTLQNDSKILIEMITIEPFTILGYQKKAEFLTFPSGQQLNQYNYFDPYQQKFIPYNLSFRIIPLNRYNQRMFNLTLGDYISFTARIVNNQKEGEFGTNYFTQATAYYNNVTQDFNLDNLTLYFASNSSDYLEFKITCSSLKLPTYNDKFPYDQNGTKAYELRFKLKTFPCQLGEVFEQTNQSCNPCTGRSYSVSYNATRCSLKDDTKIVTTNQALIQLQLGYWRAYYNSPIIDQCYHKLDNCPGGWKFGNNLCIVGHIGALCEQCDLYNVRGNGSYYVNKLYSCNTCESVSKNLLTIILISMWALVSIFITVFSTLIVLKDFILRSKLKILGYIIVDPTRIYYDYIQAAPAVLIKVLTNYLQIIFTISTFQLEIPSDITLTFNSVGNPIQVMAYSLDCFLVELTSTNIMYFRIMWSIIMCLIYIAVFFSGYVLLIFAKKASYTITVITTCLIYIYLYLSPNFIGSLISLISYRYISGEYWIQGNIAYRYDTQTHFKWLLGFAFPFLFLIALIIPIFLWYCVHTNKDLLQETKTKKIWGYLYNEYRRETYYWETIKIILKEFIIIVLAYYEDYIPIKAALIFLSLFIYSFLTNIQKPYNTGLFNRLDSHQTIVCAVSIILATTIHSAQQYQLNEIVWPFYIIIGVLNGLFFMKILYYLIQAYTNKLENQIDSLKEALFSKCPNLFYYHPFLKEFLESNSQRKKRVKLRFNKIKRYLMPQARLIFTFKKNNNIELPQSNQTIKLTNLGKMNSIKGASSQELNYNTINLQEPIITSPKQEQDIKLQNPNLIDVVNEE